MNEKENQKTTSPILDQIKNLMNKTPKFDSENHIYVPAFAVSSDYPEEIQGIRQIADPGFLLSVYDLSPGKYAQAATLIDNTKTFSFDTSRPPLASSIGPTADLFNLFFPIIYHNEASEEITGYVIADAALTWSKLL